MDGEEKSRDLDKISTRFAQFVIAVDGALVAYAIKQLEGQVLEWKLIPLGAAIIFWGLSFYYGINTIRKLIGSRVIGLYKGEFPSMRGTDSYDRIDRAERVTMEKSNKSYTRMFFSLYCGGIMFLMWQVIEMVLRTISN